MRGFGSEGGAQEGAVVGVQWGMGSSGYGVS